VRGEHIIRASSSLVDPGSPPRARGAHASGSALMVFLAGSPPRARGARNILPNFKTGKGITPACAGSTLLDLRR